MIVDYTTLDGIVYGRFQTLIEGPHAIPTMYPNAPFRRNPEDETWAQVFFLPETSTSAGFDGGTKRRTLGALIVHLYQRVGTGTKAVRAIAEAIKVAFRDQWVENAVLFFEPRRQDVGERLPGWWQMTVTCPFQYDE